MQKITNYKLSTVLLKNFEFILLLAHLDFYGSKDGRAEHRKWGSYYLATITISHANLVNTIHWV